MPFLIKDLIEGKSAPVTTSLDAQVDEALKVMIGNSFTQLPVVSAANQLEGIVTADSILKHMFCFRTSVCRLLVSECMASPAALQPYDTILTALHLLQNSSSVCIVDPLSGKLLAIVTDFDTTQFYKDRAQSAMIIEEIEAILKEIIRIPHADASESEVLASISGTIASNGQSEHFRRAIGSYLKSAGIRQPINLDLANAEFAKYLANDQANVATLDDLTLSQLISLITSKRRWGLYDAVIRKERAVVNKTLDNVRHIRNKVAHFKGEVSASEMHLLQECLAWLQIVHRRLGAKHLKADATIISQIEGQEPTLIPPASKYAATSSPTKSVEGPNVESTFDLQTALEASKLMEKLSEIPDNQERVWLTFSEVETWVGQELPHEAFERHSWWTQSGHPDLPSALWFDAGWIADIVNFGGQEVRLQRIDLGCDDDEDER